MSFLVDPMGRPSDPLPWVLQAGEIVYSAAEVRAWGRGPTLEDIIDAQNRRDADG